MQEPVDEQKTGKTYGRAAAAACWLILLLAASSLAGYALKNTALAAIFPTSIPMAPSTALCFALLSATLLLISRGRLPRAAVYPAALTVLAVSLFALFRQLPAAEKLEAIPLWRMSPLTALLFVIASAGLARAGRPAGTDRAAAALSGALLVLSFLILTGYLYGSPLFYGGNVIPVAFPTGAAFFALGIALLASNPAALAALPFTGDSLESMLFRNFLPLTAAAVLLNGFLNLGGRVMFGSRSVLNAVSALAAMAVAAWLARRVSLRVGDRIAQAQQKQAEMEGRLAVLFSNLPGAVYRCANERDWRMEFLSEGCLSLTGYPAAEFTGARPLSFGDIILPEDRSRVWNEVQEAVSAGRQYRLTYSIKTRGGAVKTVFDQGMLVKQPGSPGLVLEGYISDITELKRAEEMLTRSNERFTLAARGAGLGIWDWDVRANRLVWDDRMFQLYGAAREDFPGAYEAWLKGLHPDDRARCEKETQAALRGEGEYNTEFRVVWPGGEVRHLRALGEVFRDEEGQAVRMVGINYDITDRKKAEAALRQSSMLLNNTQSLAKVGGWEWDLAGKSMHWTEEMYRIHDFDAARAGEAPEELIEKSRKCYRPEDLPAVMEAFRRCAENGEPYDLEFQFTTAKGRELWVRTTAKAERVGDRVAKVIGTLSDITERKRAEDAVRTVSQQLQLALSAARLGWWRYDPASRVAYYDDRYKEIFEVTGSSRPNEEILKRLHPDDLPGVWARVEAALDPADPQPYSAVYRVVIPDGETKWVEAHGLALFSGEGGERRAVELVGTVEDITARRQAEAEIRKLNSDLIRKNAELENFLYVTSHDLRSPLVNIQGFSQNLAEHFSVIRDRVRAEASQDCGRELLPLLEQKVPAALGFITESAGKMDRLISALLRLSRLGRAQTRPSKVDMNALLKQTISYFSFQAGQAGAEITCGDLPPCLADREAIGQVFSNLIENALKHRHPQRGPKVEISGRTEGGRAVYQVRDNGIGIEAAESEKVWQVFYRANPSSPGEGIGLSIVKTLIEKNGGKAAVESEPGQGTVFTLELPAA